MPGGATPFGPITRPGGGPIPGGAILGGAIPGGGIIPGGAKPAAPIPGGGIIPGGGG